MMDAKPGRTEYIRRLGVFDTTMIVIGGIIGAGIFLARGGAQTAVSVACPSGF